MVNRYLEPALPTTTHEFLDRFIGLLRENVENIPLSDLGKPGRKFTWDDHKMIYRLEKSLLGALVAVHAEQIKRAKIDKLLKEDNPNPLKLLAALMAAMGKDVDARVTVMSLEDLLKDDSATKGTEPDTDDHPKS